MATRLFRREFIYVARIRSSIPQVAKRRKSHGASEPELFPPRLVLPDNHGYVPILSPQQVSSLLCMNENSMHSHVPGSHEIKGYDSNQLASNHPVEDRRNQARLLQTGGTMFAVYDGHGGSACAQAISERLFEYIAVAMLPPEELEKYNRAMRTDSPMDLLRWHKNDNEYTNEVMSILYRNSFQKYVIETLSTVFFDEDLESSAVSEALKSAFVRLDNDISVEAMPSGGSINMDALEVAMSGSCACVAHINGLDLHVANTGDCRAVLGKQTRTGDWVAEQITVDHNHMTKDEVNRVKNEHPISESTFVLRHNRLLGQLIPLRAFGDVRYKWRLSDLKNVVNILDTPYAQSIIPMNYYTPPYLITTPDVSYRRIDTDDKFLILATDGLWDMLSNEQVVRLVGEFMAGKETDENFRLPQGNMKLGAVNELLLRRKAGLANKSIDSSAATHLIRHALGFEHQKVSEMLTLPPEVVRYYRDDITVTVVFFDTDYALNNRQ